MIDLTRFVNGAANHIHSINAPINATIIRIILAVNPDQ